jgi:hypothetical protein
MSDTIQGSIFTNNLSIEDLEQIIDDMKDVKQEIRAVQEGRCKLYINLTLSDYILDQY